MRSLTLAKLASTTSLPRVAAVGQAADGEIFVGVQALEVGQAVLYRLVGEDWEAVVLPEAETLAAGLDFANDDSTLYLLAAGREDNVATRCVYSYAAGVWTLAAAGPEAAAFALASWGGELYASADEGLYVYRRYAWRLVQAWNRHAYRLRAEGGVLLADGWVLRSEQDPVGLPVTAALTPNTTCWWGGAAYALRWYWQEKAVWQQLVRLPPGGTETVVASWPVSAGGFYWFAGRHGGRIVLCGGLPGAATATGRNTSALTVTGCLGYYDGQRLLLTQAGPVVAAFVATARETLALAAPGPVAVRLGSIETSMAAPGAPSGDGPPLGERAVYLACGQMGEWGSNSAHGIVYGRGGGGETTLLTPEGVWGSALFPMVGKTVLTVGVTGGDATPQVGRTRLSVSLTEPYGLQVGYTRLTVGVTGGAEKPQVGYTRLTVGLTTGTQRPRVGRTRLVVDVGPQEKPTVGKTVLTVGLTTGTEKPTVGYTRLTLALRGAAATERPAVGLTRLTVGLRKHLTTRAVPKVGRTALYALTGPVPPGVGESVLYLTDTLGHTPRAMRVTTAGTPGADAALRGFVRLDREDKAVDDWLSYQSFALNGNVTLEQTGTAVRIALVGSGAVPDVYVQFDPE